ncbi:RNA processing protein Grc3, putative [Penicillium digitatum]|uniref:Polynucleotide 5'-hydroxyl-kinase GRC3 n=3 Tax=Penicillium digitatum TaxID=36651 RepID=K9FH42_PEND2|nr:RNA processing protein Grc3, putative [Penicillium digitatum Pd1]EKV06892.1 RNA processing protein Grc3, putative [Penicillium digitatum Pd1]EKV08800.1 RNA processing protein Grc3, putative [Penicillium digitatum PHI26]QQK41003.1 RNA processing protein Grc3, putative [Penicillium digitatum]
MVKRKAEKQQTAGPVSAVAALAARRARQQQAQSANVPKDVPKAIVESEPPSKKSRQSLEAPGATGTNEEYRGTRTKAAKNQDELFPAETTPERLVRVVRPQKLEVKPEAEDTVKQPEDEQPEKEQVEEAGEMEEDDIASVVGAADDYESPAEIPAELQNFPLSKARLNKSNIVYSDESTLCIRIKERTNLALLGYYDLWVKRGVVSLMGAKLHPSSQLHRVYAPSTHSLPVIKCVAGVDGEAEVEIKSCTSGISRLRDLSPLFQRVWAGESTAADKITLKGAAKDSKRTFSVLYTSADDSLNRHIRPLHLDKKWSASMKALSQREGQLRVLVCGPKASGKSTFSRYLLNHVLSPTPDAENGYINSDGVAFLDLDPGQPEFAPMGQVYLARLRSPFFGPPFTHPSLDDSHDGEIVRAHHIGAASPKEDPDHYALAVMDLMDQFRSLLEKHPQCPLIINYPGWIFGQGLEVVTWLVRSLGLSDVVYMSEKGPSEVVDPLGLAAREARVPLTILPSQPTDFVSRSSAQLRAMQIQSYFHMSYPNDLSTSLWSDVPLSRTRPITVNYTGARQGILGVMVMGSQINPDLLHETLEGAIVGVVAVESPKAIMRGIATPEPPNNEYHEDTDMDSANPDTGNPADLSIADSIVRTSEGLPYLFVGSGSCTPLDPKSSNCLGLALVRSIDTSSRKLELSTPIPSSHLENAIEHGHGIVLVRGQLDNPNWAISEEYYAARAAERRYQQSTSGLRKPGDSGSDQAHELDPAEHNRTLALLRERVRRASNVPWMTVVEDNSRHQREVAARREKSLWKLRKKAYPGSESEADC